MANTVTIEIECSVSSRRVLIAAARKAMVEEDGCSQEHADELIQCPESALQYLLDPGAKALDLGFQVEESRVA
jgi:hypothetical protein